ncbi:membrane protein insertion efficiency factor YidD [Candidatus Omnitrophota bacterium]
MIARSFYSMNTMIINCIKMYQTIFASYRKVPRCKFYPSCSEYAIIALQQRGTITGLWLTIRRIVRCNPLSSGGLDLP